MLSRKIRSRHSQDTRNSLQSISTPSSHTPTNENECHCMPKMTCLPSPVVKRNPVAFIKQRNPILCTCFLSLPLISMGQDKVEVWRLLQSLLRAGDWREALQYMLCSHLQNCTRQERAEGMNTTIFLSLSFCCPFCAYDWLKSSRRQRVSRGQIPRTQRGSDNGWRVQSEKKVQ